MVGGSWSTLGHLSKTFLYWEGLGASFWQTPKALSDHALWALATFFGLFTSNTCSEDVGGSHRLLVVTEDFLPLSAVLPHSPGTKSGHDFGASRCRVRFHSTMYSMAAHTES